MKKKKSNITSIYLSLSGTSTLNTTFHSVNPVIPFFQEASVAFVRGRDEILVGLPELVHLQGIHLYVWKREGEERDEEVDCVAGVLTGEWLQYVSREW